MLSRLTIIQKLTLSTLAFFACILSLAYVYTDSIGANVTFAEQEMRGNEYHRALVPLLYDINQLQILHTTGQDHSATMAKLSDDFSNLESTQEKLGEALQFTEEGLAARGRSHLKIDVIMEKWRNLKQMSALPYDDKSNETYRAMLADIRGMIAHAGDLSNLSLDPDLDSYYLMDTTLVVLPQTIDRMSQVNMMLEGKTVLTPEEMTELGIQARLFAEADLGRAAGDFDTALKEDANYNGVSETLAANLEKPIKHYVAGSEAMIAALTALSQTGLPEDIIKTSQLIKSAQAGAHDLWHVGVKELDTLLSIRIGNYNAQMTSVLIKCGVGLLLSVLFFIIVIRDIVRPLNHIRSSMGELTSGNLKHSIPHTARKDELGGMAKALEVFQRSLLETEALKAAQEEERIRNEQAKRETMTQLANKFESRVQSIIQKVASASTELYSTANEMTKIMSKTSNKAQSVSNESQRASSSVNTVAAAIEEMSASATEIAKQITNSVAAVKHTVAEVERAETTSGLLAEANTKIGAIIQLIQNIASQINLLALNATIESARAGDAGKGFAVVANEVKNLANQTSTATEEISQQIEQIQQVSQQVINVFAHIKSSIAQVDDYSSGVAAAAEEQTAATGEISSSMALASNGTTQISRDIVDVMDSSNEASVAASEVLEAARMLSEEAERLNAEVSKFLSGLKT